MQVRGLPTAPAQWLFAVIHLERGVTDRHSATGTQLNILADSRIPGTLRAGHSGVGDAREVHPQRALLPLRQRRPGLVPVPQSRVSVPPH